MKRLKNAVRRIIGGGTPEPPVRARDSVVSMLFSMDDDPHQPTKRIIDLVIEAGRLCRDISLADLARDRAGAEFVDVWPGEQYRFLAAVTQALQPKVVVEIGTYQGLSAIVMKRFLPADGRIVTFDIVPWKSLESSCFVDEDFADGRIEQRISDLSDRAQCIEQRDLLESADLLFVDGPHDGPTEERMIANLRHITFRNPPILLFDDIRLWSMLRFWRELAMPKMDVTSFGHWSGTGIAEWKP